MKLISTIMMLSLPLVTASCQKKPDADSTTVDSKATSEGTVDAPQVAPASGQQANTVAAATKFDMSSVAVSKVALGSFPYLSLPDGYEAGNIKTLDIAKVPYWVSDHFEWIEGKVYQSSISVKTGKDFSSYEIKRNIEALVQQAGGKQVFDGKIPRDAIEKLTDETKSTFNTGLGGMYSDTVTIYLIHQADRDIWIHLTTNTAGGSWAITESKSFTQTAKLLPAAGAADTSLGGTK